MQLIVELKKTTGNCDRVCCLKSPPWKVHGIIKRDFLKDFDKLFVMFLFCVFFMLYYLVQIEPVQNSDSDDSDKVSNQRGKNVKLFEISKAVLDLKLYVIIIKDTFVKY